MKTSPALMAAEARVRRTRMPSLDATREMRDERGCPLQGEVLAAAMDASPAVQGHREAFFAYERAWKEANPGC